MSKRLSSLQMHKLCANYLKEKLDVEMTRLPAQSMQRCMRTEFSLRQKKCNSLSWKCFKLMSRAPWLHFPSWKKTRGMEERRNIRTRFLRIRRKITWAAGAVSCVGSLDWEDAGTLNSVGLWVVKIIGWSTSTTKPSRHKREVTTNCAVQLACG